MSIAGYFFWFCIVVCSLCAFSLYRKHRGHWPEIWRAFRKKPPVVRTEPCPKCGTMDCVPKSRVGIRGAGQLYVIGGSNELAKTCKFRQDLRSLGKLPFTNHKATWDRYPKKK